MQNITKIADEIFSDNYISARTLQMIDASIKNFANGIVGEKIDINEITKYANKEPSFFSGTKYRLPTKEELKEIDDCNCSVGEIIQGTGYAIIGRRIKGQEQKDMIINIESLCELDPKNNNYKEALKKAKESPCHR
jgi:hypothetical protein